MTPLAFLDTETTSLDPRRRRPWEIAMIRRDDRGEWYWLLQITDVDLSDADPMSLKIGAFHDRHVSVTGGWDQEPAGHIMRMSRTEKECAAIVEEVTRGAHIVGAVPSFDETTLRDMLRRHQLAWSAHYHLIDVEALAVGYIAGRAARGDGDGGLAMPDLPWRSDELSLACDVEPPTEQERHTAMGDAKWAMRLYDAITGANESTHR